MFAGAQHGIDEEAPRSSSPAMRQGSSYETHSIGVRRYTDLSILNPSLSSPSSIEPPSTIQASQEKSLLLSGCWPFGATAPALNQPAIYVLSDARLAEPLSCVSLSA